MFQEILKKHKAAVILLGDCVFFFAALGITQLIRMQSRTVSYSVFAHPAAYGTVLMLWILIYYITDLYTYSSFRTTLQNLKLFAAALALDFLIAVSFFYIFGTSFGITPKTNLVILTVCFGLLDGMWRFAFPRMFFSKRRHLLVLVGTSPRIGEIVSDAKRRPQAGYDTLHVTEWKAAEQSIKQRYSGDMTVVIDNDTLHSKEANNGLYALIPQHIEVRTLADFYERMFGRIPLHEIEEEWFIREVSESKIYDSGKRGMDLACALISTVIASPVLLLISILVKATSAGPVLYKQSRVGRDGKLFTLYKFRNMYHTPEKNPDHDGTSPSWWQENDPRVTPVGRFLRRTHLDELGQLFNIIKGDISFVGPRPERPEFVSELETKIPHYLMRSTITPGLTGWAQIKFRYARSVLDSQEKFEYDLYYLKNRNLVLDIDIMLQTVQYVFKKQG